MGRQDVFQLELLLVTCGITVAALCVLFGMYISHWEVNERTFVDNDVERLRCLCAFDQRVGQLDVTWKEKLWNPFGRALLRTVYFIRYGRVLGCSFASLCVILYLAEICMFLGVLGSFGHHIISSLCFEMFCNVPQEVQVFSNDDTCTDMFQSLGGMLGGRPLLPQQTCSESNLLVCPQVCQPMAFWSGASTVFLIMALITIHFLVHIVPRLIEHSFAVVIDAAFDDAHGES